MKNTMTMRKQRELVGGNEEPEYFEITLHLSVMTMREFQNALNEIHNIFPKLDVVLRNGIE